MPYWVRQNAQPWHVQVHFCFVLVVDLTCAGERICRSCRTTVMRSVAFALFLAGLSQAWAATSLDIKFKPCPSSATIHSVNVDPCVQFPCPLKPNTFYNVTINVTVGEDVTSGDVSLSAVFHGVRLPYPGFSQIHMCKELSGAECPLKKGQTVIYKSVMSIPKNTPLIILPKEIPFRWSVKDKSDNEILCFDSLIGVDKSGVEIRRPIIAV